jgi:hypothetical protein
MNCSCAACQHYKNVSIIIQSANLLNIEDPATYIRTHTKSSFKITEEECDILERMKTSQDMTEYKEYLLKPSHYIIPCSIIHITCPNCDNKIKCSLSVAPPINDFIPSSDLIRSSDFICCSKLIHNNIHDHRCMYYKKN